MRNAFKPMATCFTLVFKLPYCIEFSKLALIHLKRLKFNNHNMLMLWKGSKISHHFNGHCEHQQMF